MSTNQPRPPLIVVGMHRSGTSFVSSLLHEAGLDMGSRLMPAARGNERGHYENMDFVEFHMRELRLTGHDDAGWAAVKSLVLPEDAAEEARKLIQTNANDAAWGWKDPRTTLFLDFWSSVVSDANFLYIYREPSEVVDSLYRRGDEAIQLSPELAARAYLTHNEMMLEHARRHRARSIVANVTAIVRDPEAFLATLDQKFGLGINVHAASTFEGELMQMIAPDAPQATLLRHHFPEIDRLYEDLEGEADFRSVTGGQQRVTTRNVRDAFFSDWLLESKRKSELKTYSTQLAETSEELEALKLASALRETELRASLATEQAKSQELERRSEQMTRDFVAQTEALIVEKRAESARVELLISTVQSSIFWKLKRGINRGLRLFHLSRR